MVAYSVDTPTSPSGTIVLFSGGGGTSPTGTGQDYAFAQDYFADNFQVVQFAWNSDWENTNLPPPQGNNAYNIGTAACRPATFLNYIYSTYFQNVHASNPRAGMCAQGMSGGSAAIAYSMIWYNATTYLNNVELLSGPTLADIELGCAVPTANPVSICVNNQYGCTPGTKAEVQQNAWLDSPLYLNEQRDGVATWTNDQKCNAGQNTSQDEDNAWKAQSVLPSNVQVNLSNVGLAGWLCYSIRNETCGPPDSCPNNSAAQGQQLYQLLTARILIVVIS